MQYSVASDLAENYTADMQRNSVYDIQLELLVTASLYQLLDCRRANSIVNMYSVDSGRELHN